MNTEPTVTNRWHFRLKKILRFLLHMLLRIEAEGLERIASKGPVIVYFNHTNFLDPFVVAGIIDREVTVMGKKELFSIPILGQVFRMYGVFPVRRAEGDLAAFRKALMVLRNGGLLILAPEGHRSGTGILQRGKPGIMHLALRTGAPIQPMVVLGCLPIYSNLLRLRRTPIRVIVGEAYYPRPSGLKPSREETQRMTDEAMYRLAALMPPPLRGVYDYDNVSSEADSFMSDCQASVPNCENPLGGVLA